MAEDDRLAQRFEQHRPRLRAVAYRMLGSVSDAEDAVQNAWLSLSRAESDDITNLGGWLTTVVAREALHLLRSRRRRREELVDTSLPDPVVSAPDGAEPEQKALLADSVSLALLVVLDSLSPAERLAFVLHDMFDLPFDEVAPLVDRTPAAARQLASRARRRVRGAEPPTPDQDSARQRAVVEAFFTAANAGDFDALVRLLDPEVVFRADYGSERPPEVHRGAEKIARQSRASRGAELHPVLVNGLPGVVAARSGRPVSIMAFTVVDGRIVEIDGIRDADRVQRLTAGVVRFGE
ncbi:RNA polymerase sigma factor SigJ [Saccharopolyspora mangrovi]|uniref:RNA polymerase sigma factor SigJ n=1 Tax=Saccharopolyspora mangrovi TaxID=3082379 RepID=A0ABU6AFL2_9PSEU|nr:RNA polymerase sigma factor SigJ [Saccharopolyspora sp. S2-29]MEB3370359.1 RNA polymerase sigma factor SigJ [Saccharopolyspora sp. S2-29]